MLSLIEFHDAMFGCYLLPSGAIAALLIFLSLGPHLMYKCCLR